MTAVLCPLCPPDQPCWLCGDRGVVDDALLYDNEPKISAVVVGQALARPLVVSRPPIQLEPAPQITAMFTGDDWLRTRDLIAALPGYLIAIAARMFGRRAA